MLIASVTDHRFMFEIWICVHRACKLQVNVPSWNLKSYFLWSQSTHVLLSWWKTWRLRLDNIVKISCLGPLLLLTVLTQRLGANTNMNCHDAIFTRHHWGASKSSKGLAVTHTCSHYFRYASLSECIQGFYQVPVCFIAKQIHVFSTHIFFLLFFFFFFF